MESPVAPICPHNSQMPPSSLTWTKLTPRGFPGEYGTWKTHLLMWWIVLCGRQHRQDDIHWKRCRRWWALVKMGRLLQGSDPQTHTCIIQVSSAHPRRLWLSIQDWLNFTQKFSSTIQRGWGHHTVNCPGSSRSGFQGPATYHTSVTVYLPLVPVMLLHQEIPTTKPSQYHPLQVLHNIVIITEASIYPDLQENTILS